MNFHDQDRQLRSQRPCCRDKGRMWGRAGALCLSWSLQRGQAQGPLNHPAPPLVPTGRWIACSPLMTDLLEIFIIGEDKHKAPSTTPPPPLSLQDVGPLPAL